MRRAWLALLLVLLAAAASAEPPVLRIAVLQVEAQDRLTQRLLLLAGSRPSWQAVRPQELRAATSAVGLNLEACGDACAREIGRAAAADLVVEGRFDAGGPSIAVRILETRAGRHVAGGTLSAADLAGLESALEASLPAWLAAAASSVERAPAAAPALERPAAAACTDAEVQAAIETEAVTRARVTQGLRVAALQILAPKLSEPEKKALPLDPLSDKVRSAVGEHVRGVKLMTKEEIVELVTLNIKDAEKCSDEICERDIGRATGAEFVLSGRVERARDVFQLSLVLQQPQAKDAFVVATELAQGKDFGELYANLGPAVNKIVGALNTEIDSRVRAERERKRLEAVQACNKRKEEATALARSKMQVAADAPKRAFRRKVGWGVLIAAGAGALFVSYGAVNGLSLNDKVKRGGYATPEELNEAVQEGQSFNKVVRVVAIVTGAAALTGLGFILLSQDPKEESPRASLELLPGAVVARGRF